MSYVGCSPILQAVVNGPVRIAQPRPAALRFAIFGTVLVGLFGAVGAITLIVNARGLAERSAVEILGGNTASLLGPYTTESIVDDAAGVLVMRGVTGVAWAVLVLGMAFVVRDGTLWARIMLAVLLLGGLRADIWVVSDVTLEAINQLVAAAIVLSGAVLVLLFLPSSNKYASERDRRDSIATMSP